VLHLDKGRLQQVGTPHEIYQAPANAFVADFIGESNLLSGMVEADSAGARVRLDAGPSIEIASRADQRAKCGQRARVMIRPESCVDLTTGPAQTPTNRIDGTVLEIVYVGVSDKYRLRTAEGLELLVRLPSGPGSKRYRAGESMAVGFNAADARLIELW
jgi:ABC-type Fe3+/spermidine/putrescine transport system ATPase subunit